MASIELIRWLQHFQTPWLTEVFRLITDLNSESFYIVALAFLYWSLDRQVGYRLAVLFLFSTWANGAVKDLVHTARPPESMVRHLVVQNDPAFPSGHAQGTTVFWGHLALTYKRRWLTWLAVALVALVSLSRLYLGVHWPVDLAGGMLLGMTVLALAGLAQRFEARTWQEFPWLLQLILATLAPLALLVLYNGPDAFVMVGAMAGMGLGHFLNERFLRSRTRAAWPFQTVKIIGGVAALLAVRIGLKAVLPPSDWSDLVRYVAIGLTAAYLWPWAFTRLGGGVAAPKSTGRLQG
ncbi:MAG: phosphatase PAP2 family protein [Firmicutes bacterium]|nr:phosphatase PAP2 family protein [Bacillota bacterium]